MKKILIKSGISNDKIIDILIQDNKILKLGGNIVDNEAQVVDLKSEYHISSGWIDAHTHCFPKYKLYRDNPDEIGYKQGVTTVVDAGTAGANNIKEFREFLETVKTNVFSFMNISKNGIVAQNELANLENIDIELAKKTIRENSDFILGLKIRLSKSVVGDNGIIPLEMGTEISKEMKVPIMVHIGTAPPKLDEIIAKLQKDDIISHIFNGKENGIFDKDNILKPCVVEAREKGCIFDLAHGSESMTFNTAKEALKLGIKCDLISTDIYEKNRINGPVKSLYYTMSKFLNLGYSLDEVIDMVTSKPANALGLNNKGELKVGFDGELTIFKVEDKNFNVVDVNGTMLECTKLIKPKAVVLGMEYIEVE